MLANLLATAGIRVIVLERNAGLLGLPRAIAYDAETLRLFAQVGLLRRDLARARPQSSRETLERASPVLDGGGRAGAKPIRAFRARNLLSARIRKGSAEGSRALRERSRSLRAQTRRSRTGREQSCSENRDPIGAAPLAGAIRRRLRRRNERRARHDRRTTGGFHLCRAVARRGRDREGPRREGDYLRLRPSPAARRAARRRRSRPLGVYAAARRDRRRTQRTKPGFACSFRSTRSIGRSRSSGRPSILSTPASPTDGGATAFFSPATQPT